MTEQLSLTHTFLLYYAKKANIVYRDICFDYINTHTYGNAMIFATVCVWNISSVMKRNVKN